MRFPLCCLAIMLSLLPYSVHAEDKHGIDLTLHVQSFHITRVTQEKAEAEINLTVQADADAQVEHISFSGLHVNGVAFFAQPIDASVELRRGESSSLPPVSVAVYFSDLDSLDPVDRILEDEKAQLQAEVDITIHATTLQHLFTGSARPQAVASVDEMVAVEPPGGFLGRASAVALVHLAQAATGGRDPLRGRVGASDPTWNTETGAMRTALLHSRSCYTIAQKNAGGEVCMDQLSFLIRHGTALSSAELGSPWRFDPFLTRSLADHGGHVQPGDPRITVEGGIGESLAGSVSSHGSPAVASFRATGDARLVGKIVLPGHSRIEFADRNAPDVYGLLQLPAALSGQAGFAVAAPAIRSQDHWDRLAVVRLVHAGDGAWSIKVVYLSGKAGGRSVVFSRPVDRSAIGSPILTPDGVIGVVQSETGGTLLADNTPM